MNEIPLAKAQLRAEILLARKANLASIQQKQDLAKNIISLVQRFSASRVAIYSSYSTEPDTQIAIAELLAMNVKVLVPETFNDGFMSWHEVHSEDEVELEATDLLLIPALAVDLLGNRLGRGKGYFDRALEMIQVAKVYAVVFESEVLEVIPVEAHDRKVSGVVTEAAIRDLN